MNSESPYRHFTKSFQLLLSALAIYSAAHAQARLEVVTVPAVREYNEASEIVNGTRRLTWRLPQDAWERTLIQAAERSFGMLSLKAAGPLAGMTIVRSGETGMDALAAQWEPGESTEDGVRGIWLWDTPEHSWYVIQCDPAMFSSRSSSQGLLDGLLRWQAVMPKYVSFQVQYAAASRPTFLAGYTSLPFAERGREYSIYGIRQNSESYLVIRAGKGLFSPLYPEGGIYVPERFPPLKTLAKDWDKERILSETAITWQARGPSTFTDYRDKILISELAARGITGDDLERLLLAPNPPSPTARELRANTVIWVLIDSKQLERNRDAVEDTTLKMATLPNSPLALSMILGALARVDSDYSGLAIKCLETCPDKEPALDYLFRKGSSEEAYAKMEQAAVGRLTDLQRRTLLQIRTRIESAKGRMN